MNYVSTRGEAPVLGFEDVVLTGLARDGGLYVPALPPELDFRGFAGLPFDQAAARIMTPFVGGEIPAEELSALTKAAYATFSHAAVCPLVQIGTNAWILELFHGPTFAFKDVAMQALGRFVDRSLKKRSARATVIGATSGDTGGAAIEAFKGREAVDIFILHPHGRTSEVQRKQMTTVLDDNVHNIAIEGSFDDCQALVKALFADHPLRDRLQLAGVNSINWARIMAQITYYVTAAASLGSPAAGGVAFAVPTGNFGDVFAGYMAKEIGCAIDALVIGTNANDILARTWATGVYKPLKAVATQSPSMDIQVSSNFERLLYDVVGRDPAKLRGLMNSLQQSGEITLGPTAFHELGRESRTELYAESVSEKETTDAIRALYKSTGYIADPHTAVGWSALKKVAKKQPDLFEGRPSICLATAHPAKFPEAVERAIGKKPDMPPRLAEALAGKERLAVLPNDYRAVATFIGERTRAGRA